MHIPAPNPNLFASESIPTGMGTEECGVDCRETW
jgi:hypothetical protein